MRVFDIVTVLRLPNLTSYLDATARTVQKTLRIDNAAIYKPLARLTAHPGKQLRAAFMLAIASSYNKTVKKTAVSAAAAIELVHLGSLVHDDIIDKSTTRRNLPTINQEEGSNIALITGDYVLAKACLKGLEASPVIGAKIAKVITQLCDGESRELADLNNLDRTISSYMLTINKKTASLFATACEIGGLSAEFDTETVRAVARFGELFGMSFQLIDDLIDFISTPSLLGKAVGTDIHLGLYNLPVILALQDNNKTLRATLSLKKPKLTMTTFNERIITAATLNKIILLIQDYNHQAKKALSVVHGSDFVTNLAELPDAYLKWSLRHLVAEKYRPLIADYL